MNASSWSKLTAGAIERLARRRSEHLHLVSAGDRGGYWVTTYAISPAPEIARADAAEMTRYLRLAAPSDPGRGVGELIEVGAGAQANEQFYFRPVGNTAKPGLDDAIDQAVRAALKLSIFDLTDAYAPQIR